MKKIYRTFVWFYSYILDLLIPRYCVGCDKEREALCEKCSTISYQPWAQCLVCGSRNMTGLFCVGRCRKQAPSVLKKVYWAGTYDDILKKAIGQLKYKKRKELGDPLGLLIAKKFLKYCGNFDANDFCIVPIPLHAIKLRERGFNQADLIASSFAKETEIPIERALLKKILHTNPQAKTKNRDERLHNLENAFEVYTNAKTNEVLRTKTILLIDDVSTTGATLFHASSALASAGATKIIGLVVAHG